MNFWLCFIVLFVVGSTSANYITYHDVTLSANYAITAEDLLKNVTKSLIEYDKNLDEYIDWVNFDNMFKEMLEHSGKYNIWSIGDVRKFFLESRDDYFKAVTSVYGWCGEIDIFMTAYLQLFNVYQPGVRDVQKEIIINALDTGVEKMKESLNHLDKSRENMNTGIVAISNVMSNISEAFRHDQSEHENKLHQMNQNVINSLGGSVIGGIINLIMVEAKYKPEAKRNFAQIQSSFDFMKTKILTSIDKALEIKQRLLAEIQSVVDLQAAAKANRVLMKFDFLNVIKNAATSLKTKCRTYQMKHGLNLGEKSSEEQ